MGSFDNRVVEVYTQQFGRERWLLQFCDGMVVYSIEVIGLPNLIELLAKLTQISAASVISEVATELDDLIGITQEDSRREFERRHPKSR